MTLNGGHWMRRAGGLVCGSLLGLSVRSSAPVLDRMEESARHMDTVPVVSTAHVGQSPAGSRGPVSAVADTTSVSVAIYDPNVALVEQLKSIRRLSDQNEPYAACVLAWARSDLDLGVRRGRSRRSRGYEHRQNREAFEFNERYACASTAVFHGAPVPV